jgi:hypothetical protein
MAAELTQARALALVKKHADGAIQIMGQTLLPTI